MIQLKGLLNKIKPFFVMMLFVVVLPLHGQRQLSENAKISIVTIGPYQNELYSAFGHSAIRVNDPGRINWVYHYGVFNFDQENFYWNFARGKMLYSIGRYRDYDYFRDFYINQDRYVIEQVLNLTPQENQEFFNFLQENYKPENREYYYNYVYDNCATKIRDVVVEVLPDSVIFKYDYLKDYTIRDLMDLYLDYQPWGAFAIDLGLGRQIDITAPGWDYMFLPDYIQIAFENAVIQRDSVDVPLISDSVQVYKSQGTDMENSIFTPFNTFVLLFFVVGFFTNKNYRSGRRTHWIDIFLFTLIGLAGWWLVFLWFGTEHLSKYNWNLIWAIPFHIPFIYLLKKKSWRPFLARFYRFVAIVYILIILFWFLIPQPIHQAVIPLLVTMILRSLYISYDLSKVRSSQ